MEEQIFGGQHQSGRQARPVMSAMTRGLRGRCPHCGEGRLFASFLKTVDRCECCEAEMHHHRADDLPAYLVVVIVGHIVVGAFMGVEATSTLSTWQHLAIWVPLTVGSALALCARSRERSSGCNGRFTCMVSAAKPISSKRIRKSRANPEVDAMLFRTCDNTFNRVATMSFHSARP